MTVLQQLLLLPLLAPLLAVLLLAAVNPRPPVALRVLIWTSPALPLGAWMAAAAGSGAGLSAAATLLALRQGGSAAPTAAGRTGRQSRRRPWQAAAKAAATAPGAPAGPGPVSSAGPARGPAEPAPTVEVPFRVIRKGRAADPAPAGTARAVGDGWDQALSDDWD